MAFFNVLHVALPYCLQKQPSGKWVILNREYKPIGYHTRDYIQYDDAPVAVDIPGLTPAIAEQLSFKPSPSPDRIYLYNDGSVPTHGDQDMAAYLKRLAVLAGLKIDPNATHGGR